VRASLRPGGQVVANVGNVGRVAFVRRFAEIFPQRCGQLRAWQDDNVILMGGVASLPDSAALAETARTLDAAGAHDYRFEIIARTHRPCVPRHAERELE